MRFLQGRARWRRHKALPFRAPPARKLSWYPPFAKNAKDGAHAAFALPSKIKSLGHPTRPPSSWKLADQKKKRALAVFMRVRDP